MNHSIHKSILFMTIMVLPFSILAQTAKIVAREVNPQTEQLQFYWNGASGRSYDNFKQLKGVLSAQDKELIFAMNGGMFGPDDIPVGLYIENGEEKTPLDTMTTGFGNFYLQPNGVFYLNRDQQPFITTTQAYTDPGNIAFATQSGPMLLIEGEFHPQLNKDSRSKHIRNGVGILPNGNLLFAISREPVNFHTFANYFKEKGCKNALYLDGAISKAYIPEQNLKGMSGDFVIIIGVTEKR